MADVSTLSGYLMFSHIIPVIMALLGIFLVANGIMDKRIEYTMGGIALFLGAGLLPFLFLPAIIGS